MELREIRSFEEVMRYIDQMECFHDYRTGGFIYNGDGASIYLEEDWPLEMIKDYEGAVWRIDLIGLSDLRFALDTACGFWVQEIVRGEKPGEVLIDLENGSIRAIAEDLRIILIKPGNREEPVYFPA